MAIFIPTHLGGQPARSSYADVHPEMHRDTSPEGAGRASECKRTLITCRGERNDESQRMFEMIGDETVSCSILFIYSSYGQQNATSHTISR